MSALAAYPLADLKLIYRTVHAQLTANTELLDSQLLADLQAYLQQQARAQGVSVTDHAQWDAWLGNPHTACAVRAAQRRTLE